MTRKSTSQGPGISLCDESHEAGCTIGARRARWRAACAGGLALGLAAALVLAPWTARAQDVTAAPAAAAPSVPAPAENPPAPPANPPEPPAQPQAQAESQTSGQWVYTQQYGWVWMPYGESYTYAPSTGEGEPYEYVYYPSYGWTWVVAPWVWGLGPWPYFGAFGPSHFGWYGHGWWRSPWRWHFGPAPFRGGLAFRGGFAYHGIRPAPARGGFVARGVPGHFGGFHAGGGGFHGGGGGFHGGGGHVGHAGR